MAPSSADTGHFVAAERLLFRLTRNEIVMGLDVEDMITGLDPVERRKVEELAVEFIAEEMSARELCKVRNLAQGKKPVRPAS